MTNNILYNILFDTGIYVIAIAFLAFSIEITAKKYQPVQKEGFNQNIPITCPPPISNDTVHLAHETDCTKFYKCFVGKKHLLICPLMREGDPITRLHFNRREMVCDWPWRAGCQYCPLEDKNGNWPPASRIPYEPGGCNKYYLCKNGEKQLHYCPSNMCFSRTCQSCVVNREGGKCEICALTENCSVGSKIPHECNCSKYYMCTDDGDYIQFSCADGLHFSRTTKTCTTPDKAGCIPSAL